MTRRSAGTALLALDASDELTETGPARTWRNW